MTVCKKSFIGRSFQTCAGTHEIQDHDKMDQERLKQVWAAVYLTHLPKALTNSFTDTPCSSAGRGWVTSLRDDLGDPEAGDLVVEAGDAVWAEMSILEGDRNPGEAERLPGIVETLLRSLCIGVLSKLDPKPPPNCGMLGFPKLGMTDPLNKSRNY